MYGIDQTGRQHDSFSSGSIINMQRQSEQKQIFSSTNRREKIFNVRKVPYKPFEQQKYFKPDLCLESHTTQQSRRPEYHFQVAIVSSAAYRELHHKFMRLRDEQTEQKHRKLAALNQKQEELSRHHIQQARLEGERARLCAKRDQLRYKIEQLRKRNEAMRVQQIERNEQYRIMNMEYLRNMIMSMRYQNGLEIDPDTMTYEELLQLEEKIGSVSKGFTTAQIDLIPKKTLAEDRSEVCSICYYPAKAQEEVHQLSCLHIFHCDCIREWLLKERVCPLCKQEIPVPQPSPSTDQIRPLQEENIAETQLA